MAFLDNVKNTAMSIGKDISKAAKDTADITKMKMDISKKESTIQELYVEIGKRFYEEHKNDEACEYPQVATITTTLEEIAALQSQQNDIKGVAVCPNCGAQVTAGAAFCGSCGNKMNA